MNLIVAEEVEEEDEEEEEEEEKEDFITIDLSPPPRSFPKMMTLCVRKNEATNNPSSLFCCSHIIFLDQVGVIL